jgi:hypothetical protein
VHLGAAQFIAAGNDHGDVHSAAPIARGRWDALEVACMGLKVAVMKCLNASKSCPVFGFDVGSHSVLDDWVRTNSPMT